MEIQNLVRLESVGSAIDPSTLLIYPIGADGGVDTTWGVSIYDFETEDDWTTLLSDKDADTFNRISSSHSTSTSMSMTHEQSHEALVKMEEQARLRQDPELFTTFDKAARAANDLASGDPDWTYIAGGLYVPVGEDTPRFDADKAHDRIGFVVRVFDEDGEFVSFWTATD